MNISQVYAIIFVTMTFSGVLALFSNHISTHATFPVNRFVLTWFEDFNTDQIDENVWNFNIGDGCPDLCGWGNAELQYYRRENVFIENGNLVIEARKEPFTDPETGKTYEYTSARIDTIGKLAITPPARIEVRAKLPSGKGIWPAIWMLGKEWSLLNVRAWPSCGEIDIVELIGSEPDVVHGTVHAPYCYGGRGVTSLYRLPRGFNFSQDYHVFALEWTEDYIAWFVDGQLFHIVTKREFQRKGCTWVFDKPFHLLLNIAVGGYWPGKPDDTTPFPARMYVDYIKVYKVLEPDPLLSQTDDSDNEILVRTRGWPSVSIEKIVNGGFNNPFNKDNNPLLNPDDWFLEGNISVLEDVTASNGVLALTIKPGLESEALIGISQLVWLRQGVDYEVRVKAWSTQRLNVTLEASLPSIPRRPYYSQVFSLNNVPELVRINYSHSAIGGNVVQLTLWIHVNPGLDEKTVVYFDEVEICPIEACPSIWVTETMQATIEKITETIPLSQAVSTTMITPLSEINILPSHQPRGLPIGVLGILSALAVLITGALILRFKVKK
ncbi:MAG: glycoside hydrolase family 16 protein [Desulfurococcaceae archaeon]